MIMQPNLWETIYLFMWMSEEIRNKKITCIEKSQIIIHIQKVTNLYNLELYQLLTGNN